MTSMMTSTMDLLRQVDVPEGERGPWRVERFTVDKEAADWERILAVFANGGRGVPEGTYTRLLCGGKVIMSDTPDELRDHREAVRNAHGHILITGLGLGMVVQACLDKPEVEHATVVEIEADVIALVGPHYRERYGDRLTIVEADAFTWQPPAGQRYGMVWHDVWPTICADNLAEMGRLKRRFARRCDWQGCWCEAAVRYYARQAQRERSRWGY